jgi:REP element-mobilizing transposase RayT
MESIPQRLQAPRCACRSDVAAPEDGRTPDLSRQRFDGLIFIVEAKRLPSPPHNPRMRALVRGKRERFRPVCHEDVRRGFLGWHENGYLPHRDEPGLVQFVTFRLADAFPQELRSHWEALLAIEDGRQRRVELEAYLDKGYGECHLRQPEIAKLVEDSLRFRHDTQYALRAWVIMPNHVHLLFQVQQVPMSRLVDAWKGYTAKEANKILGRKGQFWQDGYWDTYMRDGEHEGRTRRYIENNPARAGLVALPKDWLWSSARFRDESGRLAL